ncbi:MAG: hypothetical protein IJX14_07150, partial [Clostridia bacterium]|nr:hypothetical protein [Clostridia bacterium]
MTARMEMNGYFYIALAAVVLLLLPYVRIFIKRISLYLRLKRICRKRNFRMQGTNFGWLFSPWWHKRCDFVIYGDRTIYAVKLFASKSKTRRLTLTADRRFYWVKKMAITGRSPDVAIYEIPEKTRKLPEYDFSVEADPWTTAIYKPILLVHPICHEFRREYIDQ